MLPEPVLLPEPLLLYTSVTGAIATVHRWEPTGDMGVEIGLVSVAAWTLSFGMVAALANE